MRVFKRLSCLIILYIHNHKFKMRTTTILFIFLCINLSLFAQEKKVLITAEKKIINIFTKINIYEKEENSKVGEMFKNGLGKKKFIINTFDYDPSSVDTDSVTIKDMQQKNISDYLLTIIVFSVKKSIDKDDSYGKVEPVYKIRYTLYNSKNNQILADFFQISGIRYDYFQEMLKKKGVSL
jgi:hypothetical protein